MTTKLKSPRSYFHYFIFQRQTTEEDRRLLLENDMAEAREKGFWICRLWQLLLTLNLTIIFMTVALLLLLLFIIGPLGEFIVIELMYSM